MHPLVQTALVVLALLFVALAVLGYSRRKRHSRVSGPKVPLAGDSLEDTLVSLLQCSADRDNRRALVAFLQSLTQDAVRRLSGDARARIVALLNASDPEILRAAIVAVGLFGGERELAAIRRAEQRIAQIADDLAGGRYVTEEQMRITEELGLRPKRGVLDDLGGGMGVLGPPPVMRWEWPEDLPMLSRAAREAVERRALEEEEMRTLLMAARDAGEAWSAELLRPAAGLEDQDPSRLPRRAEQEESEG